MWGNVTVAQIKESFRTALLAQSRGRSADIVITEVPSSDKGMVEYELTYTNNPSKINLQVSLHDLKLAQYFGFMPTYVDRCFVTAFSRAVF
jgi:hypothetical protein